jgi:hypothetical protein
MKNTSNNLLDSFIDWANGWRTKVRDDVEVDIELGPAHEKRGAWMNVNDNTTMGHIMVWDSGEYETLCRRIDSDRDPEYFYGTGISNPEFDSLFSNFLEKFSNAN